MPQKTWQQELITQFENLHGPVPFNWQAALETKLDRHEKLSAQYNTVKTSLPYGLYGVWAILLVQGLCFLSKPTIPTEIAISQGAILALSFLAGQTFMSRLLERLSPPRTSNLKSLFTETDTLTELLSQLEKKNNELEEKIKNIGIHDLRSAVGAACGPLILHVLPTLPSEVRLITPTILAIAARGDSIFNNKSFQERQETTPTLKLT